MRKWSQDHDHPDSKREMCDHEDPGGEHVSDLSEKTTKLMILEMILITIMVIMEIM